ncbi:MAG TPA: UDP-2,3-diacylglucosamine diphosphatase, partial [Gammaproteobacteria bacterium]|nr:UDP-2,3-diacylglucosamine diphosphatase [Gammaproteobacteria bacterium]
PLTERRMMAEQARERSRSRGQTLDEDIMDVNANAVAEAFRTHAVPRMIHGHTHRPHIHRIEVDGKPRERIVLGDWYEQGSVLEVNADGAELNSLPLPGT